MPMFYTAKGFLKAIAAGDMALVDRFLQKGDAAKWVKARNEESGETALHMAARKGNTQLIHTLLAHGADIEARSAHDTTPLGVAVQTSQLRSTTALIDAGASIAANTVYGSLLETAVKRSWREGFDFLLSRNAEGGETLLTAALATKNAAMIAAVIDKGFIPEKQAARNDALYAAAQNGNQEMAQKMLALGANINAQHASSWTPLHAAIYANDAEMAKLLLAADARTDIRNDYGQTPKEMATYYGRDAITPLFKESEKARAARTATPLTAGVNRIPDKNAETWTLAGPHQVALVGVYPALARRLTHIFNFEARERLTISENLKTGAENMTPPEKFDTLEEQYLARALEAFRKLGGKVEDSHVFAGRTAKKTLSAPGA